MHHQTMQQQSTQQRSTSHQQISQHDHEKRVTNQTNTIKNVVLIGDHHSGKKIFMTRLINIHKDPDSWIDIKLRIVKSVMCYVENDPTPDKSSTSISYDMNISVILLEDMDTYDFENVHAVLFFCDGTDESQMTIWYKSYRYLKYDIPCAFLCPYDTTIISKLISANFRMIQWHCSTGPYVPATKYRDIVINLLDSNNNAEIVL